VTMAEQPDELGNWFRVGGDPRLHAFERPYDDPDWWLMAVCGAMNGVGRTAADHEAERCPDCLVLVETTDP
jgi:hypothetical protein